MNWFEKIKEVHEKADRLRSQAEVMAEKLGHKLEGWTTLQNCVCRKCGAYAKINNVYANSNGPNFVGAAFTNMCSVKFSNADSYQWKELKNRGNLLGR